MILQANDLWDTSQEGFQKLKEETGKLNADTRTALMKIIMPLIENHEGLQLLMKKSAERDRYNLDYQNLEQISKNADKKIDSALEQKMGKMGKFLNFLGQKFLGMSVKDMLKDPDSPYGDLLRGIFEINVDEKDLRKAKNPFEEKFKEKQKELEKTLEEGDLAKIEGMEVLKEEDKEASTILKSMRKYSICDGLKLNTYSKEEQTMQLKAQNWNQVIFLRKFIPHATIPEQFSDFTNKYSDYLPDDLLSAKNSEYKPAEKKDFPDIANVTSEGFDITIGWQSAKNVFNAIDD